MIEVEVKLKIENHDQLRETLLYKGFTKGDILEEEDLYFNAPDRDFRKTDEALRLRREALVSIEDSVRLVKSEKIYVTYKGKKLDSVSMSRKELETNVGDFAIMKQLFLSLGYVPTIPVTKLREICVEKESNREDALARIEKELENLGYLMANTTRTSYLSMLEELSL